MYFHYFLFDQTITNKVAGELYRPSFGRLGLNLKKKKTWRSIEVHAIYALFFILGYSREGLQILKDFLDSKYDEIYDPLFLAQMVLSPLNTIVDETLLKDAKQNDIYTTQANERNKLHKLTMMCRFDTLCRMLHILQKFGTEPVMKKKQKLVNKLINHPVHGTPAIHAAEKNKSIFVTGFTAAFFLTLPEYYEAWRKYKEKDRDSQPLIYPANFSGEACFWPTFAPKKRNAEEGSTKSNAQSVTPYSFLPTAIFDLEKLFSSCLAGDTVWSTDSLQEDCPRSPSNHHVLKPNSNEQDKHSEIEEGKEVNLEEENEDNENDQMSSERKDDIAEQSSSSADSEENENTTSPSKNQTISPSKSNERKSNIGTSAKMKNSKVSKVTSPQIAESAELSSLRQNPDKAERIDGQLQTFLDQLGEYNWNDGDDDVKMAGSIKKFQNYIDHNFILAIWDENKTKKHKH